MTHTQRYHRKQQKGKRRLSKKARLAHAQLKAQRHLQSLYTALVDLGLEKGLARSLQRKLHAQHKLLAKIFAMMFPICFGCSSYHELCRVRGWDKNLSSRILGAFPKRTWVRHLQRLGREILETLWVHMEEASAATHSRWQWTWIVDDTVFKKYGTTLELVGSWWSGQEHRVRPGINGVLLLVVIGEGKLVVPVDLAVRRPNPVGPGHPGCDKLTWARGVLDRTMEALESWGIIPTSPMVVADCWYSDSDWLIHVEHAYGGTLVVEGKRSYVFYLQDGRRVKGAQLGDLPELAWRDSPQCPGVRYARLHAYSPSYGHVTLTVVQEQGKDRYYLLSRRTAVSSPRLIRAWKRRVWIEWAFRTLKHLLKVEVCQGHREAVYWGHLVLRLLALIVLQYARQVLEKNRVTLEEMVFHLKHYWRFLESEPLEIQALSSGFLARAS